ncbi:uncharacterized protein ACA1_033520 [Acanthamoeba castellanii str. Neff]|uniref:Endonuclease/exonuclease/phosphatase domain-containing protein n=1 Tax=Acanthamoeba castellanii (strain ATCC 30010 / Neff) TaxID=1257118 RepID=L8GH93_ACACF|nr:uncharacterized protein ACA1_033520 [Acanthamoeba castellanii str. Neff]ELR12204.1 hypothetical protein ACA1_033520 [Acanthamoeba castellanii str. Neff]
MCSSEALRIITGDFNFPAGAKEEEGVAWNALRGVPTSRATPTASPSPPRSSPSRLDPILYRSDGYRVREVMTVGAEPMGRRGGSGAASKDNYPSDPFAVLSP